MCICMCRYAPPSPEKVNPGGGASLMCICAVGTVCACVFSRHRQPGGRQACSFNSSRDASRRATSKGFAKTSLAPIAMKRSVSLSNVLPVTPNIGHVTPSVLIAAVASGPLMPGITVDNKKKEGT